MGARASKHRLFTVIAGPADEAVRDPLLRYWTDAATHAKRHLLAAARLAGRFELLHQWVGSFQTPGVPRSCLDGLGARRAA